MENVWYNAPIMERAIRNRFDIGKHRRRILVGTGIAIGTFAGLNIGLPLRRFQPAEVLCTARPISTEQPVYLVRLDSGTTQWRGLPSYIATPTPGGKACSTLLGK